LDAAKSRVRVGIEDCLGTRGFGIQDGFLDADALGELSACARTRYARGEFRPARIGAGPTAERNEGIRGDLTCWLEPPLFAAEQSLLTELEVLRLKLNRQSVLGLFDLELHYAWYPAGACYARHVDRPQGRDQRCVSLALYLNQDWGPGDGGELRIYDDGQGHVDISPLGGRLVCFVTAGREHEVLAAQRERVSISGWFRTRP
jgi:SM-20-related protein